MGIARKLKRILTRSALEKGKTSAARQDGLREFISLLACISAAGKALPPTLIYRGASTELQDTWVDDVGVEDEAYFTTTQNGWTSNALALVWLYQVFDRHTKKKSRNYRLLIIDGHSSHVNLAFLEACKKLRIIVLILPPHSTHRLQPLDVGLFLPLSQFYSKELDLIMHKSDGITSLSKRNFWRVFKKAWEQAFTMKNIKSAFKKTGICPQDSTLILAQIEPQQPIKPTTPLRRSYQEIKTPYSAVALRRAKRQWRENPSEELVKKLLKANETLHVRAKIAEHRCEGLRESLQDEKKKRKRGKKTNLVGEEDSGPQLYHARRIARARAVQDEKDAITEQEMINKELKKTAKQAAKQQKELEKQEKQAEKEIIRQIAKESKEAQKTTSQRYRIHQKSTKAPESDKKIVVLRSKSTCKQYQQVEMVTLEGEVEEVVRRTNRGRSTRMPLRFRT
jgi:hypothetical protein